MENGVLATGPELPRPSLTLLGQDLTCRSPAFWLIWILVPSSATVPSLEQPHLARQFQHPHEQPLDLLEKAPPKRRNGVVVGMIVGGNEAERHRIISRPLQLRSSVENKPYLIGGRAVARHAVGGELRLVQLDQVFHLPALAVDVLVKVLRRAFERGDDVADVDLLAHAGGGTLSVVRLQ